MGALTPLVGKTTRWPRGTAPAYRTKGVACRSTRAKPFAWKRVPRYRCARSSDWRLRPSRGSRCCRCPSRASMPTCAIWWSAILPVVRGDPRRRRRPRFRRRRRGRRERLRASRFHRLGCARVRSRAPARRVLRDRDAAEPPAHAADGSMRQRAGPSRAGRPHREHRRRRVLLGQHARGVRGGGLLDGRRPAAARARANADAARRGCARPGRVPHAAARRRRPLCAGDSRDAAEQPGRSRRESHDEAHARVPCQRRSARGRCTSCPT